MNDSLLLIYNTDTLAKRSLTKKKKKQQKMTSGSSTDPMNSKFTHYTGDVDKHMHGNV